MTARPAVIDTDPGIDDALALLIAWSSPEIDLEAITTVAGNVGVGQGTDNLLRLLDLRHPARMPTVAVGAAAPLARPLRTAQGYHGEDGLGDVPGWPEVRRPSTSSAEAVLVEAARRHGGALTLIALGPLTNLARAVGADGAAMTAIGRVVVMGGAVDVPGNVTPEAEFNLHVDPEAAAEVFAAGMTIDLVPLDATRQALLTPAHLDAALAGSRGAGSERVRAVAERAMRIDLRRGQVGMTMHDPLAVAVAIDPTLVSWETVRIAIGPDGETRRAPGAPNCRVARVVGGERFSRFVIERLWPVPG
jgi:purine nucleosidase/pyrimidine-specific ribonucleoside hydrolase